MTPVARTLGVFALGLFIAGCSIERQGDDSVSKQFGSDYFGAGGSLNLTDPVAGDAMLAGGHVTTAGEVKGDLIAAGGDVSIEDLKIATITVEVPARAAYLSFDYKMYGGGDGDFATVYLDDVLIATLALIVMPWRRGCDRARQAAWDCWAQPAPPA